MRNQDAGFGELARLRSCAGVGGRQRYGDGVRRIPESQRREGQRVRPVGEEGVGRRRGKLKVKLGRRVADGQGRADGMPGSWRKQRLERLLAATGSRGTLITLSASGWCLEVGPRAGNRARKRKWVLDQQLKATTTPCLKGSGAAVVWSEAKLPSLSTSAAAAKLLRPSSVQARKNRPLFMASSMSDERVVGDRL